MLDKTESNFFSSPASLPQSPDQRPPASNKQAPASYSPPHNERRILLLVWVLSGKQQNATSTNFPSSWKQQWISYSYINYIQVLDGFLDAYCKYPGQRLYMIVSWFTNCNLTACVPPLFTVDPHPYKNITRILIITILIHNDSIFYCFIGLFS